MRWLLTISLLTILGLLLFVAGNMMRCISSSADPCPRLCYQKVRTCNSNNDDSCLEQKVCRAPDATQYTALLDQALRRFKNQLR